MAHQRWYPQTYLAPILLSSSTYNSTTPSSSSNRRSVRFLDRPHPRQLKDMQRDEQRSSKPPRRSNSTLRPASTKSSTADSSLHSATVQTSSSNNNTDTCPYLLTLERYLGTAPYAQQRPTTPKSSRRSSGRRRSYTASELLESSISSLSSSSSQATERDPNEVMVTKPYLMDCSSLPPLPRRRPGDPPVRQRYEFPWQEQLVADLNRRLVALTTERRQVAGLAAVAEQLRLEDSDDVAKNEGVESTPPTTRVEHAKGSPSPSVFSEDSWIGGSAYKAPRNSPSGASANIGSPRLIVPTIDVQKTQPAPPASWTFNIHSKYQAGNFVLTPEKLLEPLKKAEAVPRIFDTTKLAGAESLSRRMANKSEPIIPPTSNQDGGLPTAARRLPRRHTAPRRKPTSRQPLPAMQHLAL